MSEAKFTKGPWEFGKERRWLFRDNLKHDGNFSSTTILKVDDDTFRPSDANANLIAAAPELYELLAQTAEYFSDADGIDEDEYIYRQNVRATLAKARGEKS